MRYDLALDALTNNGHTIILSVHSLITCFQSINLDPKIDLAVLHPSPVDASLVQYIECAIMILCGINLLKSTKRFKDYPFQGMMMLIEKLVKISPCVITSVLEKRIPFSLLHSAYADVFNHSTRKTERMHRKDTDLRGTMYDDDNKGGEDSRASVI